MRILPTRLRPSTGLLVTSLFALLLILPIASASRGDQLPEFRECVERCVRTSCPRPLPLYLRLTFWTCPQNCDHDCQTLVTESRLRDSLPVEQFHGKWPFPRILGIQEPFSVFFSLLNGYAHLNGLRYLNSHLPVNYPMTPYYRLFAYFGMFCWFWSAVFHTRDFVFTERMDYFAAGANVLFGLYYPPIRLFRLYRPEYRAYLSVWRILCVAAYIAHVSFLTLVRWDYTYNMAANVVVGSLANILWSYYVVKNYSRTKNPVTGGRGEWWRIWPGVIVTWLIGAMSLELLDFPPVLGIDAHALWHAATVMPTVAWYWFLEADARSDVETGDERGRARGGSFVAASGKEGKEFLE